MSSIHLIISLERENSHLEWNNNCSLGNYFSIRNIIRDYYSHKR